MKRHSIIIFGLIVGIIFVGGFGYWLGSMRINSNTTSSSLLNLGNNKNSVGTKKNERKILYYRNPMGLPDTSPVPKKDPMGMNYVAVFDGDESEKSDNTATVNQLNISTDKIQKLGVRSEVAQLRSLNKTVRAAGRIDPDERRIYAISPKFEGYIERLHVNITGQYVSRGQPLFDVYSPELVSAQREYSIAIKGVGVLQGVGGQAQSGMKQLAESSLLRLKNWDISEAQIKELALSGEAKRTLSFRSPVSGIVTGKKALQGMRFMPGEELYQVTDLSSVWVIVDIFEQDIALVKLGAKAKIKISSYPDKQFEGTVSYVYPTLNSLTRTVPVRVELTNPGFLLKPAMFAQVELPVTDQNKVVTIPISAIIDSGVRQIVLIEKGAGRFEPREVKLGARSDTLIEVVDGVKDGERVVVAANFLIDAESNLKAAVGGFGHATHGESKIIEHKTVQTAPFINGVSHQAKGIVESKDINSGIISLNHGPIDSLKWPAMTMMFKVSTNSLLQAIKVGEMVEFEFVERSKGEWVITHIKPMVIKVVDPKLATPAANKHSSH